MNDFDTKSLAKDKDELQKENNIAKISTISKENVLVENDASTSIKDNSGKRVSRTMKELQEKDNDNLQEDRRDLNLLKKDDTEFSSTDDDSKIKSWKKFLGLVVLVIVLILLGISYVQYNKVEKKHMIADTVDVNDYSILVDQWNESVIKAKLNDYYLLPRDNNKKIIEKLNKLLAGYSKNGNHKESCTITRKDSKLYIPLNDYCQFVSNNTFPKQIHFTPEVNEEEILSKIKTSIKQPFIGKEMLLNLAYLNDFSIYFKHKLKIFYQKGFSRNIKTYSQYNELTKAIYKK